MDTQIAIVQFLFKQNWKVLSDSLGANPALMSNKFDNAPDTLKFCASKENCLVIANVASKDDLIQLATFIKASRKGLKTTVMKIVVVNSTDNKQFEKAIAKLGQVEILEPTVNVKALRFKMDFWMKAMRAQSKKLGGDLNKKTLEASEKEASQEVKTLVPVPALETENDIWILSRESDCKRIIGRWMVKFMGPGPFVAQWTEVPNKPNMWSFQIKKSFAEQFINGQGNWFFRGDQKPEFNWQENRWMMTGDAFELLFFDGSQSLTRAKVENKVLTIAGNSVYAKTKESLILDSFNKELVFKNEADVLKDQSLDFENEGDLGGHLEGEGGEADNLGKGHLSGKVKEQEEAGKGPLEGKIKDQEEGKGNLEGKIKDKEAAGKGPLEGKVKDREDDKSPYAGKLKPEEKAKEKEKEKHAQSNERMAGSYKGKVSEEQEKETPSKGDFKQHNEKLSNNWDGQVKTNDMEASGPSARKNAASEKDGPEGKNKGEAAERMKSHWGGKNSAEASSNTNDNSAPGPDGVKEGSLLGLKKSDDEKSHQTHYKKHNEAQQYGEGELGQNLYDDELGGKSSTDKLASHYGTGKKPGKEKQEREEEEEYSGDSQTDRLASHYGSKKYEAQEREPKSRDELGGESNTDKLPSHMGGRKNRDQVEKNDKQKSVMVGKVGSGGKEKIKSHYGTGKRPVRKDDGYPVEEESEDFISEFEEYSEESAEELLENVLPFVSKAEEKDLEKLTESGQVSSFIFQNGKRYECRLDDFFDNNIIFVCTAEGLKNSEKASLDLSFAYQGELAQVKCDGNVMSIDQDGVGSFYVTIEIKPEDTARMSEFTELMQSRQENIATFLEKARGF